jgi:predicted AAA+ superfamily ATPase
VIIEGVQEILGFEQLLCQLSLLSNVQVFVTGFNPDFLPSETKKVLSGRYVEIPILPFSFQEYLEYINANELSVIQKRQIFDDYIAKTGFPGCLNEDLSGANKYLQGIYSEVLWRDILRPFDIRNKVALTNVVSYILGKLGQFISINAISNALAADGQNVNNRTVERCILALTSSSILYGAKRFEIKEKKHLTTKEKYYIVDLGLHRAMVGNTHNISKDCILENIVFLELLRRGGDVKAGKYGRSEVDFTVRKPNGKIEYYQIINTTTSSKLKDDKMKILLNIRNNYPKYLLTLEDINTDEYGIYNFHIADWLTNTNI